MGYYSQAIVLAHSPGEELLEAIPHQFAYRVFSHRANPLWLIDLATDKRSADPPFSTYCGDEVDLVSTPPYAADLIARYTQLLRLMRPQVAYGIGWLQLAAHLSSIDRSSVFLFAADDETFNFACLAEDGRVISLQAEFEPFDVSLVAERLHVRHVVSLEDFYDEEEPRGPHYTVPCMDCDRLGAVPGVIVDSFLELDNGRPFYRVPLESWPRGWGDPIELLRLGTWDPLTNIDADFQLVRQGGPSLR